AGLLTCPYCAFENALPETDEEVEELDFHEVFATLEQQEDSAEVPTIACDSCGSNFQFDEHVTSDECPFCGSTVVATGGSRQQIKPRALLPFSIEQDNARQLFRKWISKRWFAPNKFKKRARLDSTLSGMYVPHWTYDAKASTEFQGARGIYYYVTVGSGKQRRQVRRTAWTPVSGIVNNEFDDLLVPATHTLPRKYVDKLEPWDLHNLVPFQEGYLSGFRAESYQIGLEDGFADARQQMEDPIRRTIRADIGGNEQRIQLKHTTFAGVTFKHILLPMWISAYKYKQKPYRFLVNARTREVQGERPWSWIKIGLAVVGGIAPLAAGAFFMMSQQ
ncbi:MAG: hypothetical protein O3B65_03820, partial [Chloroflexi bacterium]|nr:hypothetical protein [Chloroflexota bacterium]